MCSLWFWDCFSFSVVVLLPLPWGFLLRKKNFAYTNVLNCFTYVFSSSFTVLNYIFRCLTQFDFFLMYSEKWRSSFLCLHTQGSHLNTRAHTHAICTHTHTRTCTHTLFLTSLTEDNVFSPIYALHELWQASDGSLFHSLGLWIIFLTNASTIGSPQLGRKFWSKALFTSYSGTL